MFKLFIFTLMLSVPLTLTASSSEPMELKQLLERVTDLLTSKKGVLVYETVQAHYEHTLPHDNDAVIIIILLPLENNEAQEPLFFECFDKKSDEIKCVEVYFDDKSQKKRHPAEKGR